MEEVTLIVNGKQFRTTLVVARRSGLIDELMKLDDFDGTIGLKEIDEIIFSHVLEFMRLDTYPISKKYRHRLDYFRVHYDPKMWEKCKFCSKIRMDGCKYCEEHRCKLFCCSSPRGLGWFCIRHTCGYKGCADAVFSLEDRITFSCTNHRCYDHDCRYPQLENDMGCVMHKL